MKPQGIRLTGRPPTLLLCQIFVLFWGCGTIAFAAEKVINVGLYDNPPKIYMDNNGRPSGIFVDLLDHIANIEDWQINYHYHTWNECLLQLENGNIDLLPDVAYTPERKNRFEFNAIEVLESWSQVYVRDNRQITQLSHLRGKRVAILNGSVQQASFRQIMRGFDYPYTEMPVASFTEALSMVSIEVADAAITNNFFGDLNASVYDLQKSSIIFNPASLYFAMRPFGDASIINTIDLYLNIWKSTPQSFYYATLQKFTLPETPPGKSPRKMILTGLFLVILVTFALLLRSKQKRLKKLMNHLKDQQRLLSKEENKFHRCFENSPLGMFVSDSRGRYTEVNPAACDLTGYQSRELKRLTIADLIPESGRKAAGHHFNQLKTEGRAQGTMPYRTKSGEIRHWSVNAVKIEEDQFIGFVEDISDKLQMEEERLQLPDKLEQHVKEKTHELNLRISELEHFREVTIERELRMEELKSEIKRLKTTYNRH